MERDLEGRMHKLLNHNQEKENNSELLNHNLRLNYASQPTLSNSLNFPSRNNIIRLKELPIVDKKKTQTSGGSCIQPEPLRIKNSLDNATRYRSCTPPGASNRSENDNYTEEYADELYCWLMTRENRYGPFLKKHEVDASLRGRMVDWMVEVLTSYKCTNRTFFKTVDLMDRYFQLEERQQPISKLHLVGVTSIYIATKIEEIYPIKLRTVEEKIAHRKLSEKQILEKENDFLRAMNFNVLGETIFDIGCLLLCRIANNAQVKEVGVRFSEKKMLEMEDMIAHMAKIVIFSYSILSSYPKSTIATALLLATLTASSYLTQFLQEKVEKFAQGTSLQQCYEDMVKYLKEFHSRNPSLQNMKRFSKVDHEKLISKL